MGTERTGARFRFISHLQDPRSPEDGVANCEPRFLALEIASDEARKAE